MMASSEEIAAALMWAISTLDAGFETGGEEAEKSTRASKILASHLSRLREEAEFRDAAMALGFVVDAARPDPAFADETAGGRALRDFHLAYRALEGE